MPLACSQHIATPTNVGAIFRSAAALGVDAVLVSPRCGDPLYRRSVRVSMGTVFQVPWARLESWPDGLHSLRELGFTVAALELTEDAVLAAANPGKLALVLGTEGAGMSPETLAAVDLAVKIRCAPAWTRSTLRPRPRWRSGSCAAGTERLVRTQVRTVLRFPL